MKIRNRRNGRIPLLPVSLEISSRGALERPRLWRNNSSSSGSASSSLILNATEWDNEREHGWRLRRLGTLDYEMSEGIGFCQHELVASRGAAICSEWTNNLALLKIVLSASMHDTSAASHLEHMPYLSTPRCRGKLQELAISTCRTCSICVTS